MTLFELLGKISIDNSGANKALDETSDTGQKAESKLGKAFKAVGKGAVAVGKTIATGMAVGATAVGALVTKSVQSYADYEQLVGGVETLFKDSAKKVQDYAANAYKTAGLSANEYMETVTSFSASLLQSLEGDTAKAADYAHMAITDMSDNANKMGTDMSLIQNAYNGFAKANFTMLDNLKLGYGGTQKEMQRLLEDAQAISGIEYDISSYADIVDAIHVIQTEMGITGTTAKEASSTISGSIASMKSSWQNLLTAISSDDLPFDEYVNNFVDSVATVADNLMPRIEIALNGVVSLIDKLVPVIVDKIPSLFESLLPAVIKGATGMVNSLANALPEILGALTNILPTLISGITTIFNTLAKQIPTILDQILKAVTDLIPELVKTITNVVTTIAKELPKILKSLATQLPKMIQELVKALLDNLPIIIDGLVTMFNEIINYLPTFIDTLLALITGLVQMIVEQLPVILPLLLDAVVQMITMLVEQIPVILPVLVEAIVSIINMLGEMLPELIPVLVEALVSIIYLLIDQLPVIIPMLIDACITIVMAIIEALPDILTALIDALPIILKAVWDAIVMIFTNLPKWFGQIFKGAVDIIKAAWSVVVGFFKDIWNAICKIFEPVVNFFKDIFQGAWDGIKSAWSAVGDFFSGIWSGIKNAFSAVGTWFKGIFQGAWDGIKKVFSGVGKFFTGMWDTIKNAFSALGTKISDAISGAVKAGLNGMLGIVESIVNGFLKLINGAISVINAIPGVEISKVKLVKFTRFAEGGVVDEPTPGVFGEDGAEAIVPLENNTGWINRVAKQLHEFSMDTKYDLSGALATRSVDLQEQQLSEMQMLNGKVDRIITMMVQFFPDMLEALNIQMYLDTGVLVAESAPAMDAELGKIAIMKGRGR